MVWREYRIYADFPQAFNTCAGVALKSETNLILSQLPVQCQHILEHVLFANQ